MLVRVYNGNNRFTFRDRFGGQEYKFPAGDTVTIPQEAAEHIWGYGMPPKERFKKMMRMGLANKPDGQKIWDRVVLKAASNVEATGKTKDVDRVHEPGTSAAP